ncbi:MAG: carbon-nitrogen family hydrolase [Chloroflexi bacterium]|nr:carbon-nitrogen family hydrolase [Chloroflexota bacterium]
MTRISVSLGQMNIALGQVEANFEKAESLIAKAGNLKSDLVILPELWTTGYDLENAMSYADELHAGSFARLSALAEEYRIAIYGSVLERANGAAMNCAALHAADGRLSGTYRKIHLFRLFDEHLWLGEGESPTALDLSWGMTGLSICYDLRFPELFRRYAVKDQAKLILLCAEWPLARVEHWRALLKARAIENQCYIVATNACGETGGTAFGGHSMVIDPWGQVLIEGGEDEELLTAEIDLDEVNRVRMKIPVFEDRRPDAYL